jgi:hypothetical protein
MRWYCRFFLFVVFLGVLPFGVFGSGGCEDRPDEVVCRSGPSDEEVELNRLRSLTREERSWEMLQSMDVKIRLEFPKKPLSDLPNK